MKSRIDIIKSFKFWRNFGVGYLAAVGGLWQLIEAYTYFQGEQLKEFLGNYWLMFYGVSILIAFGYAYSIIKKQKLIENNALSDLIKKFGSRDRGTAIVASEELRWLGLLCGGQLQGVDLQGADLREADLSSANLQKARLGGARLQKANLTYALLRWVELTSANLKSANMAYANLWRANLVEANLQEANLLRADLQRANLWMANLRRANLREAFLQSAKLRDADLLGADLQGAKLERAVLPDGTRWGQDTDMRRFTDSSHPDFWHSDYSSSLSLWLDN